MRSGSLAHLDSAPSVAVKPPRVAAAKVAYECVLDQVVHVGGAKDGAGSLVLGTVLRIHVSDDVWTGTRIDTDKLNAIGRCAGDEYTRTHDRFSMIRPGNPGGPPCRISNAPRQPAQVIHTLISS